jgi:arylsulfatase A-like enzyme
VKTLILSMALALTAKAAPPNVVMIISDDQHWGDYGFMGHPHIQTPQLDKLAKQSLTFPRGYVPSSLCGPSLATIITGRFPHQHRVTSNDPAKPDDLPKKKFLQSKAFKEGRQRMVEHIQEWPLLPALLGKQGYLSFQTGKWWLGEFSTGGFTHGMTRGGRHGDEGLDIGRKTMQPIYDFISGAKKESKPFFIWYAPMMPHDPHTPPERLLAKYRDKTPSIHVAKYWAMVDWFDETCGQLMDHLEKEGIAENTIVIYVTDNGWITDPATGKYAPRSKLSPYDGGIRTPIMIRWLGKLAPQMNDTPVSSIDLLPTILKACGVQPPKDLPGIDLTDSTAVSTRKTLTGDCYTHAFVDQEKPATSLRWRWIIEDGWKLIVPAPQNEKGDPELYQIRKDPNEEDNRAAAEPERAAALRKKLDAWWPGV